MRRTFRRSLKWFVLGLLCTAKLYFTGWSLSFTFRAQPSVSEDPSLVDLAFNGPWTPYVVDDLNHHYEEVLDSCSAGGKCTQNADKVVIFAYGHCLAVLQKAMQGENVWCEALIDATRALGYSMLFVEGIRDLRVMYRKYHKQTRAIIWSNDDFPGEGGRCLYNPMCAYLDPDAYAAPNATHALIPAWQVFTMHFWQGTAHPLGAPFTLSPEDYSTWPSSSARHNYYLGYSLEKTCKHTRYIPPLERPRLAYVFAKESSYFFEEQYILPEHGDFFSKLAADANMHFLGNFHRREGEAVPPGIAETGHLNRHEFQAVVAEARAVLGIGKPPLSPTPWEVLCLGVPFINPVLEWDEGHPDDRTRWNSQHDGILFSGLDEPYVYHVKRGDREGFERAIKNALDTPIPRYIPPKMKMAAFRDRVKVLLEKDWIPVARQQLRLDLSNQGPNPIPS